MLWTVVGVVTMVVLCGGAAIGGALYFRAQRADYLRLDGLAAADGKLDELKALQLPGDTELVRLATDGTTLYYLAYQPTVGTKVVAVAIKGGGHAWEVSLGLDPRVEDARLTLVGDVLLVDVVDKSRTPMVLTQRALSTGDGKELSKREGKQDQTAYAAIADGSVILAHDGDSRSSSVVERQDLKTGKAAWTYPVDDAGTALLAVSVSWPGGPNTGPVPYRHPGELSERGETTLRTSLVADPGTLVFNDNRGVVHVLDGATGKLRVQKKIERWTWMVVTGGLVIGSFGTTTTAYDLTTLTERWRVSGRALNYGMCGASALCLSVPAGDKSLVRPIDVTTGKTNPDATDFDATDFTPLDRRVLGSNVVAGTVIRDAATWDKTRLLQRDLDVKPLAAAGRYAVLEVSAPGILKSGVSVLDVESLRYTQAVAMGDSDYSFDATADIAGGVAVVLTTDRRILALKVPF
ncbi:outer membrane protein assembly factor BamB family protein [Dactylosporangium matsuzakiense]|uniref:Pyrrolo-quinoline quinone repeat domain-containing protein n=1 Tax=Dactylosporangium matsuzakiense TaxID=53360 RepID=A0A9W6KK54_9ACTN|nr:hypothetical protein [Dactylosporangium matsuzakiense]UWZ48054.1 hypothetical protein Dmats_17635 [Dactylosporangium matsuzakiense]GLL03541.1 hypothetical protein GCM10017581_052870 [Dactylosporangium matsuzakiense]